MGVVLNKTSVGNIILFDKGGLSDTYKVDEVTDDEVALVIVDFCECCDTWLPRGSGLPQWFWKLEVYPTSELINED